MGSTITKCIALSAAVIFSTLPTISAFAHDSSVEVECFGVNGCKGQSKCGTANNACMGQNSCKGKGMIKMSRADCEKNGGTYKVWKKTKEDKKSY